MCRVRTCVLLACSLSLSLSLSLELCSITRVYSTFPFFDLLLHLFLSLTHSRRNGPRPNLCCVDTLVGAYVYTMCVFDFLLLQVLVRVARVQLPSK
jgi:hypothetical protein